MSKLSPRAQWGILIGGYFGNQLLGSAARANPELAPWILPLRILYVVFAVLTWTASPLFNLLLRLNRFGRLALSREQTVASNWFGVCLLLAVVALAGCLATSFSPTWLMALVVCGFLLLPLTGTFKCQPGWPRRVMATYTAAMAVCGFAAVTLIALHYNDSKMTDTEAGLLGLFLIGAVGSGWVANILIGMRPKH